MSVIKADNEAETETPLTPASQSMHLAPDTHFPRVKLVKTVILRMEKGQRRAVNFWLFLLIL